VNDAFSPLRCPSRRGCGVRALAGGQALRRPLPLRRRQRLRRPPPSFKSASMGRASIPADVPVAGRATGATRVHAHDGPDVCHGGRLPEPRHPPQSAARSSDGRSMSPRRPRATSPSPAGWACSPAAWWSSRLTSEPASPLEPRRHGLPRYSSLPTALKWPSPKTPDRAATNGPSGGPPSSRAWMRPPPEQRERSRRTNPRRYRRWVAGWRGPGCGHLGSAPPTGYRTTRGLRSGRAAGCGVLEAVHDDLCSRGPAELARGSTMCCGSVVETARKLYVRVDAYVEAASRMRARHPRAERGSLHPAKRSPSPPSSTTSR